MSALAPTLSRKRWMISGFHHAQHVRETPPRAVSSWAISTYSSAACACAMSPGPNTTASMPALGQPRRLGPERRGRPASSRARAQQRLEAAPCRAWRSDGLAIVTDQAIACGDVAARTRRSASASSSSTRSPGAGRSENVSVARVGMTLKAMPPSSAGDVQVDALEPRRPLRPVLDAHVVQRDRRARQHRDRVHHLVDARRVPARPPPA